MGSGITTAPPAPPPRDEHRNRFPSRRYVIGAVIGLVLIIALVALIRYRGGSERRRYEASLRSALDRLVTAQEGFYYDSTRYTASLRSLPTIHLPDGVHVEIFSQDRQSWWGLASHDRLPERRCIVWVGVPPSAVPAEARAAEDETKPLCFDAARIAVRQAASS
jgi:type II secretory pathway pseudopilin PulG